MRLQGGTSYLGHKLFFIGQRAISKNIPGVLLGVFLEC